MRRLHFPTLLLLLAALLAGVLFIHKKSDTPPTIVAFGDSLTYGIGSVQGGGFVNILERDLNISIENLGVSGDTSADGLARIDKILAKKPTITIVLFGGNDVRKGVSPLTTAKNVALIDATLKHAGSKVLLLNLGVLNGIWGHQDLMSDSLHPNDAGYVRMAERIKPELRKLLRQ